MSLKGQKLHFADEICQGIPENLPEKKSLDPLVAHAPVRNIQGLLTREEKKLAIANALRYFPENLHPELAPEFTEELLHFGRIYMYRFRPTYPMYARPLKAYPAKCVEAASIMLMIQNNLDPKVAKYPHELITYGGNGAVFQNWAQYLLVMKYLSEMTEDQTLVLYSGHPLGLFPSHKKAPRVVVTNGMMVPNYSTKTDWNKYNALGVTQYGQMTAGSFMYIGPQGIVHGTTITLLNAGRLNDLGSDLRGKIFVTSGLGGMSGAQSLAAIITGAIGVIAEVDGDAIEQRITDGYISSDMVHTSLDDLVATMERYRSTRTPGCLIFHGNIVDLWEHMVTKGIHIDLGSDQTSCHNVEEMGYCPVGYTFDEAKQLLAEDRDRFMTEVRATLRRHIDSIKEMTTRGMYFWDYGNAFLKEASQAGADVWKDKEEGTFLYPSYVEDIMGPMCFDFGFGPFRWVCTSGLDEDLRTTDRIAASVIKEMISEAPDDIQSQLSDNLKWIVEAEEKIPQVGSMSRILYADAEGRIRIANAFNEAIAAGKITAPIVLGRDHHDVSGTDSPFRETANIYDGSRYCADMAVHNVIGDAFRGATWVSLHNGGGVGWGDAINGGFGMVIDGSQRCRESIESMLHWDVNNGIARRSWARNSGANDTILRAMVSEPRLKVTMPHKADDALLDELVDQKLNKL